MSQGEIGWRSAPESSLEERDAMIGIFLHCPFCGESVEKDLMDSFHPSGTYWRLRNGRKSYYSFRERKEGDQPCWSINCLTHMGGCGAEMTGDTKQEVIDYWNRRVNDIE